MSDQRATTDPPHASTGYFLAGSDFIGVREAAAPPRRSTDDSRTRSAVITVGSVALAWIWTILIASHLKVPPAVHRTALFAHLAALVIGFGSVLVADLFGLLWITGKRPLRDVVSVIDVLHIPIWVGLELLVVSGMLLQPDLGVGRVRVKMVLVLVAALNGLWATGLSKQLRAIDGERPPATLLTQMMTTACISQCAWWGATLVGFLSVSA